MKIDMVDYLRLLNLHLQLSRDGDRDGGVRGWGAVWEGVPAVEETDPGQAGEPLFKKNVQPGEHDKKTGEWLFKVEKTEKPSKLNKSGDKL